jgi:hypothetical protein
VCIVKVYMPLLLLLLLPLQDLRRGMLPVTGAAS